MTSTVATASLSKKQKKRVATVLLLLVAVDGPVLVALILFVFGCFGCMGAFLIVNFAVQYSNRGALPNSPDGLLGFFL